MTNFLISVLVFACVASAAILPAAVVALLGAVRKVARLEERNAAQAMTIGGLQRRLDRDEVTRVWPSAAVEAAAWKEAWMRAQPDAEIG